MGSPFKKSKEERKEENAGALAAFGGAAAFSALKEAGEADVVAEAAGQPVSVSIDVPPARRLSAAGAAKVPTKTEHVTIRMTPAFKEACTAAAARRGLRLSSLVERLMQAVIEQDRAAGLID